ncbi:pkbA, partial [Symbiodinium pilosum]
VDIYNLGVLLYTMLMGLPPFFHREKEMLRQNIANQRLELPSCLSEDASSLIKATMEREPERRLGARDTADVKRHEFFKKIDFEALAARKVPAPALPDLPNLAPEDANSWESPPRRPGRRSSRGFNVHIEGWDFKDPEVAVEVPIASYLQRSPARKPKNVRFRGLNCVRWMFR